MTSRWVLAVTLSLAVLAGPAMAAGTAHIPPRADAPARVIDGDTLHWQGRRIRLAGIDAPEKDQFCHDATGRAWLCGQESSRALADLVRDAGDRLWCADEGEDRYGRTVATCFAGKRSINRAMVEQGHAMDWPKYSKGAYQEAQERARAARRGIWADPDPVAPWRWRQNKSGK